MDQPDRRRGRPLSFERFALYVVLASAAAVLGCVGALLLLARCLGLR